MASNRSLMIAFIVFSIGLGRAAHADWLNLTSAVSAPNTAEIHVEDDRVRLALEVYVEDISSFEALLPDNWLNDHQQDRPPLDERMRLFSENIFQIRSETGDLLRAEMALVEPRLRKDRFSFFAGMINPSTRKPMPEAPADKRVLYAEIEYPFSARPKSLTIVPPQALGADGMMDIGFITYHKAVPVNEFAYLSVAETLALDWQDPWYSSFENPRLKRQHKSAIMSFLYVEPFEVRHEVLMRVKDLERWIELGLRSDAVIEADEWDTLMTRVSAFLSSKNPVNIDGEFVEPAFSRANFVTVGQSGTQVIEEPRQLALSTAMLGVILSYPREAMADAVTVDWELYTDRVQNVPAMTIDPAGPFTSFAVPHDRTVEWQNYLNDFDQPVIEPIRSGVDRSPYAERLALFMAVLAVAALGLAIKSWFLPRPVSIGACALLLLLSGMLSSIDAFDIDNPFRTAPDRNAAGEIVAKLAGNLHDALKMPEEARLHDAVAVSVAEQSFEQVMPEIRRALEVEIPGGGKAMIDGVTDVELAEVESLGGGGFRTSATWHAQARAGHWGHIHQRRMRFNALIEAMPLGGAWKIVGLTVLDVQQENPDI
ncbi:MAG: hypothetical protein ACR2QJ_07265 [Geminicoccaceae bacterium]